MAEGLSAEEKIFNIGMMQEKINKRLVISLLILSVITVVVFVFSGNEGSRVINKDIFSIEALDKVDRVVIKEKEKTVELHFNGSRWKVNNTLNADAGLIQVLFATLKQAEPRRPITGSLQDSLIQMISISGRTIELYAGDQLQKRFRVGGNESKTQTYFATESGEIYLMTIPGYRVNIAGIFELDAQGWRDKTVFDFHWRNFQGLKMNYPAKPSNNFQVALKDGIFGVSGLEKTDTVKLAGYMDQVFSLKVDEYMIDNKMLDSMSQISPQAVLTVSDIANNHHRFRIYSAENERVMVVLGDDQLAWINRRQVRPLLQPKSYFKPL